MTNNNQEKKIKEKDKIKQQLENLAIMTNEKRHDILIALYLSDLIESGEL